MASSFSQGDAFISSKPERTIDLHVLAAEPARGAAAIHRGVAAAEHDDALADLVDVAERDAGQPVDADMDVLGRFLAAGDLEIAAARRAAADEDRIEIFGQQRLQAVDALAADELDAEVEDVAAFLVDHAFRQAEFRNLGAHHAAGQRVLIEHDALVAQRRKVARHGERGGAAAHKRHALAVFVRGRFGQAVADVILEVGGNALEPADRDRLLLDAAAAARRLARAIAGAAEHAREYVRFPVDHVGIAVAAGGDQTNVFRYGRVRRTCPLAIHDFVEIIRDRNVGRFHSHSSCAASAALGAAFAVAARIGVSPTAFFRLPMPGGDTS